MKAIAAIMLMVVVVCTACTKDPDNGGNGGGASPTTEGIYLGIIGFNYNLFPKEIGLLNSSTKSSFTNFIDNLSMENLCRLHRIEKASNLWRTSETDQCGIGDFYRWPGQRFFG